jgi:hypothetical protein
MTNPKALHYFAPMGEKDEFVKNEVFHMFQDFLLSDDIADVWYHWCAQESNQC